MSEFKAIESKLLGVYNGWDLGKQYEKDDNYSYMFRMSIPQEYFSNGKPLLMYVGQQCRDCLEYKTKDNWFSKFTALQILGVPFPGEKKASYPFWNFARRLSKIDNGFNIVWNNLDKFHTGNNNTVPFEDAKKLNAPFGKDHLSVLQREIQISNPKIIVFAIGKGPHTASLASAFSIDPELLEKYEPQVDNPVHEISDILGLDNIWAFWCYHPGYLQRIGKYNEVLDKIQGRILGH